VGGHRRDEGIQSLGHCSGPARPTSADRAGPLGPGPASRRAPRPDRAGRRRRAHEQRDRGRAGDQCRDGPQVAQTVPRRGNGWADRPAPVGAAAGVHRDAGRSGQGAGLHPARAGRAPVVAVVGHRAGQRGRRPRHGGHDQPGHRGPLAGRRRDQTMAAPVLDLASRPRLRSLGRPGVGPVRAPLGRTCARRGRVRDQCRREVPTAGTAPPAPRPSTGACPSRPSPRCSDTTPWT